MSVSLGWPQRRDTVGVSSQGLIPQSEGDIGITVVLFLVISHNLLILSDRSTCAYANNDQVSIKWPEKTQNSSVFHPTLSLSAVKISKQLGMISSCVIISLFYSLTFVWVMGFWWSSCFPVLREFQHCRRSVSIKRAESWWLFFLPFIYLDVVQVHMAPEVAKWIAHRRALFVLKLK